MKSYASSDLKQNLGDVLAAASHEPVSITKHRKARYVLMSIETYHARFTKDERRSYALDEMPDEHLKMLESVMTDKDNE